MAGLSTASPALGATHAGARIRARRIAMGMRQKALAQSVGISASYLNLIEHDRRRIGGRLLVAIARRLNVDPLQLGEGAQRSLVEGLESACATMGVAHEEAEPAGELAQRFPGWARLILSQHARIEAQTRQIAGLSDRLSQDPQLAASMHEVLSVATAIRSTAGILGADTELDREWLARFHRNIYEDSQRLAEGTRGLVAYLEQTEEPAEAAAPLPQEELERWLAARDFHVAELEDGSATPEQVAEVIDATARAAGSFEYARAALDQYRREAITLPVETLAQALAENTGRPDPLAAARRLAMPFALVLRRIAALPPAAGIECGLVVCDGSGAILYHRPVNGFVMPRFGQACPLLPLYTAFGQLRRPLREIIEPSGYAARHFLAFAEAEPILPAGYGGQVARSTMLLLPAADDQDSTEPRTATGPGCRLCPRRACPARREPSVLMQPR